ncbi:PREDICTED: selection and upkeep of intraepithelial T-cells protein 7-like isoform X1 [Cyprinodon variegatus]|uniref:selection and upkeep of intraepithelial T-cells protein 7-like isoform X1 n=2 Tax=Cyprinodon variegatus TaxID=28743 RepID=UPI000742BDA5|nr:PREDICTED: selection and upkeep of intraepithelial T-cells protein 7-like isoform X1 [Cyprinodon variegatus]
MYFCIYFVLGLLSLKGMSFADPNLQQILAFAGGHAILPCSLKTPANDDVPTVEWSKEGLKPNVVFLYRNGFETFEMKNPAFEFRSSLFMREVKNGNVSLRISNLKPSDTGIYRCLIIQRNGTREATEVRLIVAAVSDPKLSVKSDENQRVTVACEAPCWLPAPLMAIVDEKENNITDSVEIRREETTGCYTVRQTATVRSHTNRVICRVEQIETNHSRTLDIFLSAQWKMSDFKVAMFFLEVVASVSLLGLFVFCIWCTCSKYGKRRQVTKRIESNPELTGVTCESVQLLITPSMIHGADNTENRTMENLEKEVADLRFENCKKDEMILKLWGEIKAMASRLDYVTKQSSSNFSKKNYLKEEHQSHSSNPGPDHAKHRHFRFHSSPTLLFCSNSAGVKIDENVFCPAMDPRTNPVKKGCLYPRRHSLGFLPSFRSKKGYIPLPHLPEHCGASDDQHTVGTPEPG